MTRKIALAIFCSAIACVLSARSEPIAYSESGHLVQPEPVIRGLAAYYKIWDIKSAECHSELTGNLVRLSTKVQAANLSDGWLSHDDPDNERLRLLKDADLCVDDTFGRFLQDYVEAREVERRLFELVEPKGN